MKLSKAYVATGAIAFVLAAVGAHAEETLCKVDVLELKCVANAVRQEAPAEKNTAVSSPLRTLLLKIGETLGYSGEEADLDQLKKQSLVFKRDKKKNQDSIVVLDNAISAHAKELRAVMSPKLLKPSSPEADLYKEFVKQRLEYFSNTRAEFYEGGPFEVLTRTYLSTAFEETYFLGDLSLTSPLEFNLSAPHQKIKSKDDLLRAALRLTTVNLERLSNSDYLPVDQRKYFPNDYRFRHFLLNFVIGDTAQAKADLRKLVEVGKNYDLATPEADHIYLYKAYPTPYKMTFRTRSTAAESNVEIVDPDTIKRFFNPAQLAMYACSRLNEIGAQNALKLAAAIAGIPLSDYYVIASSTNDKADAEKLVSRINDIFSHHKEDVSKLEQRVAAGERAEFSSAMNTGAKLCDIDDATRLKVFSPFALRARLFSKNFGRFGFHVVVGGHLNFTQAQTVVEFLNSVVLKTSASESKPAYVARMKLNG